MKKNFKVFTVIAVALLLICSAIGFTAFADNTDTAPTVEIYKKNISYDDVIQLTYALKADGMTDGQKVQVLFGDAAFTVGSAANVADVTGASYAKEQKAGNQITVDNVTYPIIFSKGIAAQDMTKSVFALPVITDAEGNIVASGACVEYSLYNYVTDRIMGNPTADQKALYKALLDYGAAVQDLMLPAGETAPADGWADRYCRVVFCDTVLAADGSFVRGNDHNHKDQFVRPGESVDLTATATDKDGHEFYGFYVNGTQVSGNASYTYTTHTFGSSYAMAGYMHDYTEEIAKSATLATAATETAFAKYYYSCANCGNVNESEGAATFENGMKVISQDTFTGDYSGNGAYYANNGVVNGVTYTGNKLASASATFGTWKPLQLGNAVDATGVKHVFEADIMIPTEEAAKITMSAPVSGKDKNIGWFGLSNNSTVSNSNEYIFAGFYVNVVMNDSGVATGFALSNTTSKSNEAVNALFGAFNFGQWYNICIEVTANAEDLDSVAEYYINGVHVGTEIFLDAQSKVTANTKINKFVCIGRSGGTGDVAAAVNFANIFYGTEKAHVHQYTEEVVDEQYRVDPSDTTSPIEYYKSCTCGLAGEETFNHYTFTAGSGVYYNDHGDYIGTKNGWSMLVSSDYTVSKEAVTPTLDSEKGVLNQGVGTWGYSLIKNNNQVEGTKHVIETDIKFSGIAYNAAQTRFASVSFTSAANGAYANAFLRFFAHAIAENGTVTGVQLSTDTDKINSSGKVIYNLALNTWYNLRIESEEVATDAGKNIVYSVYINGGLVYEGVNTDQAVTALATGSLTGLAVEPRGDRSGTISLDNTFMGTYLPPRELGTGVYYNNPGSYIGQKYDFSDKTDIFSNNPSAVIIKDTADVLESEMGLTYIRFNIKGGDTVGTTHVFETDIKFHVEAGTKLTSTDTNVAWFGISEKTTGDNNAFGHLYVNAITDSEGNVTGFGLSQTKYLSTDNGVLQANTRYGQFELDRWYNFRFEITILTASSGQDLTASCKAYIDDELVASSTSYDPYYKGLTTTTPPAASFFLVSRSVLTEAAVVTFDNMFFGTIPTEE